MTLVRKDLKKISERLARLKPAQPNLDCDLPVTEREAVEILAPRLRLMKTQGFTLPELTAALAKEGLAIKPNTLGRYLAEGNEEAVDSRENKKATPAAAPITKRQVLPTPASSPPEARYFTNPARETGAARPLEP